MNVKRIQLILAGIAAVVAVVVITKPSDAGSPVYVGRQTTGSASLDAINHSAWHQLLQKYVDTDGMVNYRAWHASQADRRKLSQYLDQLSTASSRTKSNRDAKLAFWINAYNAVTVHGILREYPTTSIRNHTARVFGYNIWKDLQLYVGGQPHSLEDIEHQILRKMNEPRIHFAIVCASIGCPRLLNEAYTPAKVQQQLELNAKDFFSRPQNFRYDPASQSFQLSSILSWFGSDFGATQSAQLQRIAPWLPKNAQAAAKTGRGRVSFLEYNWNLNEKSGR